MRSCSRALCGLALVASLFLASCSSVQQAKVSQSVEPQATKESQEADAKYREGIVGTWIYEQGALARWETACSADGRFEKSGNIVTSEGLKKIRVKGTWKVENGRLIETPLEMDPPDKSKIGTSRWIKIVSLTESELTLLNDNGVTIVDTRKRPENPLMTEFAAKTLMMEDLSSITDSIVADFDEGIDRAAPAQRPPAEVASFMRNLLASAFAADRLAASMLKEMEIKLSPEEIRAIIQWYETPLGKKTKEILLTSQKPEKKAERDAYIAGLRQNPAPPNRLKLIQELDRTCKQTEATVTLIQGIQLASVASAMAFAPPENQIPLDKLNESIQKQRPQLLAMLEPIMVGSYLYGFQSLPDKEVEEYVRFQTSELGKKFNEIGDAVLSKAMFDSAARYVQSMGMLRQKNNKKSGA